MTVTLEAVTDYKVDNIQTVTYFIQLLSTNFLHSGLCVGSKFD